MGQTARHGWPTPEDTDRVAAGAAAIRALGDAIDDAVPFIGVGSVQVSNLASAATQDVAGTWAGGPLPSAPVALLTGVSSGNLNVAVIGSTASGFTVRFRNEGGSAATGTAWVAGLTGPLTAAALPAEGAADA